jgi:hypothetical protein
MITLQERFIVDENSQRVGVLLDIEDYHQLLEDVEELEAIRAYDAAKASGYDAIPLEQVFAEEDIAAGKLDALADAAIADHKVGRTKKLGGIGLYAWAPLPSFIC